MSKKITSTEQTRNFMYFMSNFTPGFINKVWQDEPRLADHLTEKIRGKCLGESYISVRAFTDWYYELSSDRQTQLIDWVTENYQAFNPITNINYSVNVTVLQHTILSLIVSAMYGERGFSDINISDVIKAVSMSYDTVKRVIDSLVEMNLIDIGVENFIGIIYLTELTEGLVNNWLYNEGAQNPIHLVVTNKSV